MSPTRGFALITSADFIVRSAYQMGKTPLLPIYAASLGAGDAFLGFIVSVSTLTGMLLKPFVGILSDRWGRRAWLLAGTAFFAGMPLVYRFVQTPDQLFAVRMAHGLATAIYGPVTLAYVAELSRSRRAERLGWFSAARNAGYVIGPLAAGWMLLTMEPASVFTVIGAISTAAFIPVLLLPQGPPSRPRLPILGQAIAALWSGSRTPAVWLAGGLNAAVLVAVYAARAFVPLHAISVGASVLVAGAFFSVQEATHMALSPIGGRISDRLGHLRTAALGMAVLGAALPALTLAESAAGLLAPALLVGAAQALVFPSTVALVAERVDEQNLGLGMGLVGTLKNAAKVSGPILAGVLIYWLDFAAAFRLLGAALLIVATVVWLRAHHARRPRRSEEAAPA